jgi:hypothetical protein
VAEVQPHVGFVVDKMQVSSEPIVRFFLVNHPSSCATHTSAAAVVVVIIIIIIIIIMKLLEAVATRNCLTSHKNKIKHKSRHQTLELNL